MSRTLRKPLPSQQELLDVLHYDPETGALTWKKALNRRIAPGRPAGTWGNYGRDKRIRRKVTINRYTYVSARLIWKMMTGEDPGAFHVDHKDLDTTNESWENLRLATQKQNNQNISSRNHLPKGVTWDPVNSKWRAKIRENGKTKHLGRFGSIAEAAAAYNEAARRLHGEFARLN